MKRPKPVKQWMPADIKIALKDTYCRCTGYQSVINAILQASGQDM